MYTNRRLPSKNLLRRHRIFTLWLSSKFSQAVEVFVCLMTSVVHEPLLCQHSKTWQGCLMSCQRCPPHLHGTEIRKHLEGPVLLFSLVLIRNLHNQRSQPHLLLQVLRPSFGDSFSGFFLTNQMTPSRPRRMRP